ncbi:MAG: GNAT family N-acetyltransferase, partial [Oscillospiraceae bacterium]|nr:GNAT family N-acetyltransferase [Oscillospiraceae bacterium]
VIQVVLDSLFSKGIGYVWACCIQDNAASKNLIEKMGFAFMQEGVYFSESFQKEFPSYEYRMSKSDWAVKNGGGNG